VALINYYELYNGEASIGVGWVTPNQGGCWVCGEGNHPSSTSATIIITMWTPLTPE